MRELQVTKIILCFYISVCCNFQIFNGTVLLGLAYKNKIYILDGKPEVFNVATNVWTALPIPPASIGFDGCAVQWTDSLLVFGNGKYQRFNLTTQQWTAITTSPFPPANRPACITLPTGDVLLVGSAWSNYPKIAMLYKVKANTWTILPNTTISQGPTNVVKLGQRIFALGGLSTSVEEFKYTTNTWLPVTPTLKTNHNGYSAAVAVPASLFSAGTGGCQGVN